MPSWVDCIRGIWTDFGLRFFTCPPFFSPAYTKIYAIFLLTKYLILVDQIIARCSLTNGVKSQNPRSNRLCFAIHVEQDHP